MSLEERAVGCWPSNAQGVTAVHQLCPASRFPRVFPVWLGGRGTPWVSLRRAHSTQLCKYEREVQVGTWRFPLPLTRLDDAQQDNPMIINRQTKDGLFARCARPRYNLASAYAGTLWSRNCCTSSAGTNRTRHGRGAPSPTFQFCTQQMDGHVSFPMTPSAAQRRLMEDDLDVSLCSAPTMRHHLDFGEKRGRNKRGWAYQVL